MKKYNKPMIEIIAFQSKENIAAVNPLTVTTGKNVKTTVYNLSLLAQSSLVADDTTPVDDGTGAGE